MRILCRQLYLCQSRQSQITTDLTTQLYPNTSTDSSPTSTMYQTNFDGTTSINTTPVQTTSVTSKPTTDIDSIQTSILNRETTIHFTEESTMKISTTSSPTTTMYQTTTMY